jgi:hypothetical protein
LRGSYDSRLRTGQVPVRQERRTNLIATGVLVASFKPGERGQPGASQNGYCEHLAVLCQRKRKILARRGASWGSREMVTGVSIEATDALHGCQHINGKTLTFKNDSKRSFTNLLAHSVTVVAHKTIAAAGMARMGRGGGYDMWCSHLRLRLLFWNPRIKTVLNRNGREKMAC